MRIGGSLLMGTEEACWRMSEYGADSRGSYATCGSGGPLGWVDDALDLGAGDIPRDDLLPVWEHASIADKELSGRSEGVEAVRVRQ